LVALAIASVAAATLWIAPAVGVPLRLRTAPQVAEPVADCQPFGDRPCAFPFPDNRFTRPDPTTVTGIRVRLPAAALPVSSQGVTLNVGPYDVNDGFSPGSTLIVHVPALDNQLAWQHTGAAGLLGIDQSLASSQPIVVIDEQTGQRVPIWSELDPPHAPPGSTDLVIHAPGSWVEGHTYAVALRRLRNAAGQLLPAPRWFARLLGGRPLPPKLRPQARRYSLIFRSLAQARVARGGLYEAWDFTVGSSQSLTSRMLAIRDNAYAQLGDDLARGVVTGNAPAFTITGTSPEPLDVSLVTGTIKVPCYLKACLPNSAARFHYSSRSPNATPTQIPGTFAYPSFECIVPADASPATPARISLYGHGFLSTGMDITQMAPLMLASTYDMVLCATDWWGLAQGDKWNDVSAMLDPNLLPAQIDRMQQGVLNMLYLGRLMDSPGGLASSPAFQHDGRSVLDTSQLYYYGNSTGGIEGSIVTAVSPDIRRAVLGVTGIDWSNWLIPRTQGIGDFGTEQDLVYPDPSAQPLMLDLMQQLWDRGDPDGYVQQLISHQLPGTLPHQVLMQIAYGDEYVPMYAGAAEARTAGVDAYTPALDPDRAADANLFWGLAPVSSSPFAGSLIELWDLGPGLVRSPPVASEKPPPDEPPYINPHQSIMYSPAALAQTSDFLTADGAFVDVCNGAPCHAAGYQP
jgi:hypothetical protein